MDGRSKGYAIYYPHIKVKDPNWLKASLLYFDTIKRMLPEDYDPRKDDSGDREVEEAIADGAIEGTPISKKRIEMAEGRLLATIDSLSSRNGSAEFQAQIVQGSRNERDFDRLVSEMQRGADPSGGLIDLWGSKMGQMLRQSLLAANLAEDDADGNLWVNSAIARTYLCAMANTIAEELGYPVITDESLNQAVSLVQQERVNGGISNKSKNVVFDLKLQFPGPKDVGHLSMKEILAFRAKTVEERHKFRESLEGLVQEATQIENVENQRDFLADRARLIAAEIESQRKRLADLKIVGFHDALKIAAPTLAGSVIGGLITPALAPVLAKAGLSFGYFAWWKNVEMKLEDQKRKSQWQYLLDVQQLKM